MQDNAGADWYGPDAATFGDRIAAARENQGMTQGQLARRIGVKQGTLRGWEEDRNEPRAYRLNMMAGILNVSMMWLLTGEGEGLDNPDAQVGAADVEDLLIELRALKTVMTASSERLGRLEKKLRQRLTDPVA